MTRISDLLVERVHLGEATEEQRALVLADPSARARLDALPAQDRAFLTAMPADDMVPAIERRARIARARSEESGRMSWRGGFVLLAPIVALLLAVFLVRPTAEAPQSDTFVDDTTAKGLDGGLRLYVSGTAGPERITSDRTVRAGDLLQVGYVAGSARNGVIVSIDGRGGVTLHFPARIGDPTRLDPGENLVPAAFRLDDAPAFERFFFVTSPAPIDVQAVVVAAETHARTGGATGDLALPAGLAQVSEMVRKEVP